MRIPPIVSAQIGLGSALVVLCDDTFRFEVDLASGATVGDVHLPMRSPAPTSPAICRSVGTDLTAAGDATFSYTGQCRVPE